MKTQHNIALWLGLSFACILAGACNKRIKCPSYLDVETISVAEANFEPAASGYFRLKRSRYNNLIVEKKRVHTPAQKSRQMQEEKYFKKDPLLFYDRKDKHVVRQKAAKKSKRESKTECPDPPCPPGR